MDHTVLLLTILALPAVVITTKPPGYVAAPSEPDPHPPHYEYGYSIDSSVSPNAGGSSQGHQESRNGINTQGNYYVHLGGGEADSDVRYIADDWGYHPIVRCVNLNNVS